MVHILMISAEFSPHQPTPTRVSTLAKIFARQGHKVILLSNSGRLVKGPVSSLLKNLVPMKAEDDQVTWLFPPVVRSGSARSLLKAMEGFLSIASTLMFSIIFLLPGKKNIQVIYSSTAQSQGLIGSLLKTILHRPLVVNYGDPAFVRDTGIVRSVEKLFEIIALSKSDLVVTTDPVIADYVSEEYGKSAIFLPNGYDAEIFGGITGYRASPSAAKTVTFVGKVDLSIYRLDLLLNALRLLRDRFQTVRLRIIGNGPDLARLKFLTKHLGLEGSVEFVGLVPHEDVPQWLVESDICVHMTNDMCTGIKVAEYMAAKRPIVIAAPWWNRYNQYLMNRFNCIMIPLVAEKLAAAILELLKSPSIAERIAANGFETVSPWTWETIARRKMALIEEHCVENPRRPARRRK
jgi:glycosyltransferase involved in cell wall biosynthesis